MGFATVLRKLRGIFPLGVFWIRASSPAESTIPQVLETVVFRRDFRFGFGNGFLPIVNFGTDAI